MGDRNTGGGRHRNGRADAGDDLDGDGRPCQSQGFLTAPAEDERIAPLQPHDAATAAGVVDEEGIDLFLLQAVIPAHLAGEDPERSARRFVE